MLFATHNQLPAKLVRGCDYIT